MRTVGPYLSFHRPLAGMMSLLTRRFLLIGIAFSIMMQALPGRAQTTPHFAECTLRTSSNATVIFPADASISLGADSIEVGDEIAVFNTAGECVGAASWSGQNITLTVWGSDLVHGQNMGLDEGDEMAFRAWDRSEQMEYSDETLSLSDKKPYLISENRYTSDGIYVVEALRFHADARASR